MKDLVKYAYKDKARTVKVLAREALKEDKGLRFYCPNHLCDAKMSIVIKEGVSTSFFRGQGHLDDCIHYTRSNSFKPVEYNEKAFDFKSALMSLTQKGISQSNKLTSNNHSNGPAVDKPLRTIRQIYDMCTWHDDCSDTYNGVMVGHMLLNDESAKMYKSGVVGWRLIEAKRKPKKFYVTEKMEIHLIAPIEQNKYTFILKFGDVKLYREIKDWIYANMNYIFVVAGDWASSNSSNDYTAHIFTRKQITMIK
ncbi:MAG: hypothetical protein ACE3L7_32965 [Candidatus Pristimantibacillus sp.]